MKQNCRTILVALAGSLLVIGLMAGCSDDSGGECPAGQIECDGKCTNPNFDPNNCGACGTVCGADQTCNNGSCSCGSLTDCSGSCVNTNNDPANCGSCGNACATGEVCNNGTCEGGCPTGLTDCSGSCVDTNSDESNCGSCDNACGTGQVCTSGTCQCPTGQTDCSGTCVNTTSDVNNCGSCGNACASGEVCNNGTCEGACPGTLTDCSGSCVDTNSDNANCGGCGQTCDTTAGFTCVSGACACIGGMTDCSGTCVDTNNNTSNCGSCGNACASGEVCSAGVCTSSCPGTQTLCGGVCVDLQTDGNNCGTCGVACTGGQVCTAGTCACPTGETDCSGTCVNTNTSTSHCGSCGNACSTGEICNAGTCEVSCPTGQTACAGVCVDLTSDDNNCGTCGVACTGGNVCVSSNCECPSTLPNDCSGTCVDLQSDESNCGTCGNTCANNETCSSGTCVTSPVVTVQISCAATSLPINDTTQCTATGVLQNGATVPLTSDPKLTWAAANNPTNPVTCTGTAGIINYDPGTGPVKGLFYANEVGCKSDVTATYAGTVVSNLVTISVVATQIQSVTIIPADPKVPWLVGSVFSTAPNGCTAASGQRLQIDFKLQINWDNGSTTIAANPTWFSSNGNAATIATTGTATIAGNTAPTANQTTTIQAAWVDAGGTNWSDSTTLTVVPPTLTGLTISPDTATVPIGGNEGFKIVAIFNGTDSFDVTALKDAGSPYTGWPAAELDVVTTYLTDAGIDSTTLEHEVTGVATTTTATDVTARFCNTTTYQTAVAKVTVTGGQLFKCTIEPVTPPTSGCGVNSTTPCTYAKGANDVPYKACGYYTDATSTCVDITDQVVWSSMNTTVATADNATDHEGEVDMLDVGSTAVQADATAIQAGVAKCSSYLKVVNGKTCGVDVVPWWKGQPGRRLYRRSCTGLGGCTAHTQGDRPRLPNETGWTQSFKAYAYISTTATCPTTPSAIRALLKVDVTDTATWGLTPADAQKPALSYTGTAGSYTTIGDTATVSRADIVTAKYPEVEGSTTMLTGKMMVSVCGAKYTGSLRVASVFGEGTGEYDVTKVTTYAGDKSKAYHLAQRYDGTCPMPSYVDGCGETIPLRTLTNYLLEVTEDATLWAPANAAVATVSNQADHKGEISAVAAGTTQIRGTFDGVTAELDFTVGTAVVTSCAITPITGTLSYYAGPPVVASTQQFTATAKMSDGTTEDITDSVDWGSSNTGCAQFFSTSDEGLLTAVAGGGCTTKITAVATGLGSPTTPNPACTPVNPNEPEVTSNSATIAKYFIQTPDKTCFDAEPTSVTLTKDTEMDLYGCVLFSNGAVEMVDLNVDTGAATWFSPDITIATVTSKGNVAAVAAGTVSVQSSYGGQSDTIGVTVTTTAISSIELTGINKGAKNCSSQDSGGTTHEFCELEGTGIQYRVIGTRTDSTTQDLTTMASYACDNGGSNCQSGSNGVLIWDPDMPGFAAYVYNYATDQNLTLELSASVTIGSTVLNTTADSATVRWFANDINNLGNPTAMAVSVTPASVSGAGKYLKAKTVATMGFINNIEIDVTNNVAYTLTQNGSAASVYSTLNNQGEFAYTNGYIVSNGVTSATTVQLTATGGQCWPGWCTPSGYPTLTNNTTFVVNP